MPWNGSGVFARVYSWVADAAAGLDILADRMDQDTDDIAQGLMHCLTVNGETVPTANLPMANFRHTGVSAGVADTDYCTVGQIKNGGGGLPSGGYLGLAGGTMTGRLIIENSGNPGISLINTGGGGPFGIWNGANHLGFGLTDAAGTPAGQDLASMDVTGNWFFYQNVEVVGTLFPSSFQLNGGDLALGNGASGNIVRPSAGQSLALCAVGGGNITAILLGAATTTANGQLAVNGNATVNGQLAVNGNATVAVLTANNNRIIAQGGSSPSVACYNTVDGLAWGMWAASSVLNWGSTSGAGTPATGLMHLDGAGNLTIAGTLTQGSDRRLKDEIVPWRTGLSALRLLMPVSFVYNGRGGTRADGRRRIGLLADDAAAALPESVGAYRRRLDPDDAEPSEIKTLDWAPPLVYALLNAVNELAQRLDALEPARAGG